MHTQTCFSLTESLSNPPENNNFNFRVSGIAVCALIFLVFLFLLPAPAGAAKAKSTKNTSKNVAPAPDTSEVYRTLEQSFQKTLGIEKEKLKTLEERFSRIPEFKKNLETTHDKFQTILATQANLIVLPSVDLQSLVQAHNQKKVILDSINDRIAKLNEYHEQYKGMKAETAEQITFYKDQVAGLKSRQSNATVSETLIQQLDSLIEVLTRKQEKIDVFFSFSQEWSDKFGILKTELNALSRKYEEIIAKREKRRITSQDTSPIVRVMHGEFRENVKESARKTAFMLSGKFWSKPDEVKWENFGVFIASFLVLFGIAETFLCLVRRYCRKMNTYGQDASNFWKKLTLKLVDRTLLIAGAIAFLYYYPVRPVYRMIPAYGLIPLTIRILFLLLAVQWGMVFLRSKRVPEGNPFFLRVYPMLRRLLIGVAIYGTGYFIIGQLYCEDCMLLISWRLVFEIGLIGWTARFFRVFRLHGSELGLSGTRWFEMSRPIIVVAGYLIVFMGFLAEMTGFGGFAAFWYLGLGQTALVLMWSLIFHGMLSELDTAPATVEKEETEAAGEKQPYPVRWLLVRLLRMGFVFAVFFALPTAWGAERTFLADLFYAINYRLDIGNIQLSVMGLFYAVIVLLIVHTLSAVWKSVLHDKILHDSKLDNGLKDSITRITGYGIWCIGILIALRVLGISATSLTVIFGAVGIGLGFGLQNIFNNFISGIILLFERPIQVGDVIEIDGTWGVVREINVRSTNVKTYDNADLIIPNSDFISQRLINWSFHDARVRRKIRIGVAYGSDIHLVRDTLLNIALNQPKILKRPKPDVLFIDFGDSALIFDLRFWCHIDHCPEAETAVRFEIDNQFNALNIKIPFPQRDINIVDSSFILKKESNEEAMTPEISGVVKAAGGE